MGSCTALHHSHARHHRRLRENERCHQFPSIFPAEISLTLNLFDRLIAVTLQQRFQGLLGKINFPLNFVRHSGGSVTEKTSSRLHDFHLKLSDPYEWTASIIPCRHLI